MELRHHTSISNFSSSKGSGMKYKTIFCKTGVTFFFILYRSFPKGSAHKLLLDVCAVQAIEIVLHAMILPMIYMKCAYKHAKG